MNRWWFLCALLVSFLLFPSVSAFAMPEFLQLYLSDPFRKPGAASCNTCHMSRDGGDERNVFGKAFETGGEMITPLLRSQFPDRFVYPVSKASDVVTIHFSDPANKQIVVESGGKQMLVDVEKKTVDGQAATVPGGAAVTSAVPANQSENRRENIPVDEYAREGAFFGSNLVNLPNGKPQKAGSVDFLIGHRFTQDIKPAGTWRSAWSNLFGFDSSATVAYGARVGLTDRVAVAMMRSNYFKTIEFSSTLQVSRQKGAVPVTFQVRGGIEGKQNFHDQYRPFVQFVAVRTFLDRLSFLAAPTFSFNTRDENTFLPPQFIFGGEFNNTTSLGLGVGIRFLPTVSLVGEVIPRLHGFKGERLDRAGMSFALQKSTFRHTFELVVSKQEPMTTAQYAVQGVDTLRIGFNIYRRIR